MYTDAHTLSLHDVLPTSRPGRADCWGGSDSDCRPAPSQGTHRGTHGVELGLRSADGSRRLGGRDRSRRPNPRPGSSRLVPMTRRSWICVSVAVLILAGCGGDSDDDAATAPKTEQDRGVVPQVASYEIVVDRDQRCLVGLFSSEEPTA